MSMLRDASHSVSIVSCLPMPSHSSSRIRAIRDGFNDSVSLIIQLNNDYKNLSVDNLGRGGFVLLSRYLKDALRDEIERIRCNYYTPTTIYKGSFLDKMFEALALDGEGDDLITSVNAKLHRINASVVAERKQRTLELAGFNQAQGAGAVALLPLLPLQGTVVKQLYDQVILLGKLMGSTDVLKSPLDIINDLKRQLITDMEGYLSDNPSTSTVKRKFIDDLKDCVEGFDLNSDNRGDFAGYCLKL